MKSVLLAIAALVAAPATAQTIEVGNANWDRLPQIAVDSDRLEYPAMVEEVSRLIRSRECSFKDQTSRRFDVVVPFAVQVDAQGKLSRVLVGETSCRGLEGMVADAVVALGNMGELKAAGAAPGRWHASEINFTLQ